MSKTMSLVMAFVCFLSAILLMRWAASQGGKVEVVPTVVAEQQLLTKEQRIAQVIDYCRHELQADGPCLTYDALRRTDPTQAAELADKNPILGKYVRRITKIETGK